MVYLFVGIGGIIGSLLRYLLSQITFPLMSDFPLGTLLVNLLGAFILGWFAGKILPIITISTHIKTGISTGIIGSFTTFSTLSVEVVQLINNSEWSAVVIYIMISLIGGLSLTALGYISGSRRLAEVDLP
jgi:fluoride exporter